jgi:transcriptional regulator with XRE-family HTH domain
MGGKRGSAYYNNLSYRRNGVSATSAFAKALQDRLGAKGWNQSDLAREATARLPRSSKGPIGRDAISHYVRGVSLPRPDRLTAIAKALGCASNELLPPHLVPSTENTGLEFKELSNDQYLLRVNRVVSLATAIKVVELIKGGEVQ